MPEPSARSARIVTAGARVLILGSGVGDNQAGAVFRIGKEFVR